MDPSFLKNADIQKAVVDGNGSKSLIEQCGIVGFRKITVPKVAEVTQANGDFEQAVFSGHLQHMEQPSLDELVTNCEHRAIGSNGGFGYRTLVSGRDATLIEANALAYWLCETSKTTKQVVNY